MRTHSLVLCSALLAHVVHAAPPPPSDDDVPEAPVQAAETADGGADAPVAPPEVPSEPSDLERRALALLQRELVTPLQRRESKRSSFTRAAMPPRERRVRILDAQPQRDVVGGSFLTFVVDTRFSFDDEWNTADLAGCVYVDRKAIYLERGDGFRAAAEWLGKKAKHPPNSVCKAVDALAPDS